MSIFLDAQPEEYQDAVAALLQREAVPSAILLSMDFADGAVRMCNRNIPFTDLRWGYEWGAASHLPIAINDIEVDSDGGEELAPFREYAIGIPPDPAEPELWAAKIVEDMSNVANYRGRECGLWLQLFDPDTGAPVGWPSALDTSLMDKMRASFTRGAAVVFMQVESLLARKGVPVYGMQTDLDQQRRYTGDLGMQFTAEASRLVVWTDY
ncbi:MULTISPECIES: hypothetical protein [unclassified Marinovum]|uniref:hypothetical protein n=1 Tax=unclassified Marinovum TaxID=2647166 RepID=UPI003EDBEF0F